MDIVAQITEWTDGFLTGELFLVEVENREGSEKISVFIDGDTGIDIPACQKLSRFLSEKLDEQNYGEHPYYLEVSSPGADSPLIKFRQYPKHVGRELLVKLKDNTETSGKLVSVTNEAITIAIKDKKKGYVNAPEQTITFADINEASVILAFK